MKLFRVSPSPHIHSGESVNRLMYGVIFALVPSAIASVYFFGMASLILMLTAVISCIIFEYIIQYFIDKEKKTIFDGSAVITGILLAMNVPYHIPLWMLIAGSFVAIVIAKMSFGGLGNNPFNPALVGRVFMLISFPVEMTKYKIPADFVDAQSGQTVLSMIKESSLPASELVEKLPGLTDMFIGKMGGSIGEVSALAILIGLIFMLFRKIITWHIPVSVIVSIYVFTGILHLVNPNEYVDPLIHVLSGGLLLGAVFMATDYVSSPMTKKGMLIYGTLIGLLTGIIRIFGSYPEGISFAILIMNAFTPLINRYVKPSRFGKEIKHG